jgi:hypothetical protein
MMIMTLMTRRFRMAHVYSRCFRAFHYFQAQTRPILISILQIAQINRCAAYPELSP